MYIINVEIINKLKIGDTTMKKITLNEKAVLDNIFEGYPVTLTNERDEKITVSYVGDGCTRPFVAITEHLVENELRAFETSEELMAYISKPNGLGIIDVKY